MVTPYERMLRVESDGGRVDCHLAPFETSRHQKGMKLIIWRYNESSLLFASIELACGEIAWRLSGKESHQMQHNYLIDL